MNQDMRGKTVVITGANSGIGLVAAKQLAAAGAEVALLCRNPAKGAAAQKAVAEAASGPAPALFQVALDDQASVRKVATRLAESYQSIDVLLNNAGALFAKRKFSPQGIEECFATNHLGPFLLTLLTMPLLRAAPAARVVTVSSRVHAGELDFDNLQSERSFSPLKAYGATKLENILFTYELARRLAGSTVTANCLAPGIVASEFGRGMGFAGFMSRLLARSPMGVSPEEGAKTSIYLASSPEAANVTGKYFYKCEPAQSKPISYDEEVARRLWDISARLVGCDLAPA